MIKTLFKVTSRHLFYTLVPNWFIEWPWSLCRRREPFYCWTEKWGVKYASKLYIVKSLISLFCERPNNPNVNCWTSDVFLTQLMSTIINISPPKFERKLYKWIVFRFSFSNEGLKVYFLTVEGQIRVSKFHYRDIDKSKPRWINVLLCEGKHVLMFKHEWPLIDFTSIFGRVDGTSDLDDTVIPSNKFFSFSFSHS